MTEEKPKKTVELLSLHEVEAIYRGMVGKLHAGEIKETDQDMRVIFSTYMGMRLLAASANALAYYAIPPPDGGSSDIGPSESENGVPMLIPGMRARSVLAGIYQGFGSKLRVPPRQHDTEKKIIIQ